MNGFVLTCNAINCNNKLLERAYVTSCSHIFCKNHGDILVMDGRVSGSCFVCNTHLDKQYDCLLMDLNPSDQYKSVILNGLNPEQIMDIANQAISFFMYQINFDEQMKENYIKNLKRQQEEILISMSNSFKTELLKKERFCDAQKAELEEKERDLEIQKQKLFQLSRENRHLRLRIENTRREQIFKRPNMDVHQQDSSSCAFFSSSSENFNFDEYNDSSSHSTTEPIFK